MKKKKKKEKLTDPQKMALGRCWEDIHGVVSSYQVGVHTLNALERRGLLNHLGTDEEQPPTHLYVITRAGREAFENRHNQG